MKTFADEKSYVLFYAYTLKSFKMFLNGDIEWICLFSFYISHCAGFFLYYVVIYLISNAGLLYVFWGIMYMTVDRLHRVSDNYGHLLL